MNECEWLSVMFVSLSLAIVSHLKLRWAIRRQNCTLKNRSYKKICSEKIIDTIRRFFSRKVNLSNGFILHCVHSHSSLDAAGLKKEPMELISVAFGSASWSGLCAVSFSELPWTLLRAAA